MIPFSKHPLYSEILKALPEGDYADFCVPTPEQQLTLEEVRPEFLDAAEVYGVSQEDALKSLMRANEMKEKFRLLNYVGTHVFHKLFSEDEGFPSISALDDHLVRMHNMSGNYAQQELWSNAFALKYMHELGWADDDDLGKIFKNRKHSRRYVVTLKSLKPDIENNSRELTGQVHRKYVARYANDCGIAEDYQEMTEQQFAEEVKHMVVQESPNGDLEEMLLKAIMRTMFSESVDGLKA